MSLVEGQEIAGYRILRSLGAGGMGEVYLAQHPRLPRQDALKVLSAEVSAESEYASGSTGRPTSPQPYGIRTSSGVHDRGEFDGQLWISMDYVDGTDTDRLLGTYPRGCRPPRSRDRQRGRRRPRLRAPTQPASPGRQARQHPDRRPGYRRANHVGGLRYRPTGRDTSGFTATNMTVGTVAYAAPEQLMGDDVDGRADQYALAASAFTSSPVRRRFNTRIRPSSSAST